jgi:hypothetical protein
MKRLTMSALVAAQIMLAAQPAMAAELIDDKGLTSQRHGAFAGARLRVPLGGAGDHKVRAGMTVAPIGQGRDMSGSQRIRFGEGLELALAGKNKPVLALAGRPVGRIGRIAQGGRTAPDGTRLGTSTGRGLLIVGGVVVVTLGALALLIVAQE